MNSCVLFTVPSSEYVITVRAMNNRGEGLTRYTTAITTKESGKADPRVMESRPQNHLLITG